ncbi:trihelix transcription factor ASR3-like [Apium graveolens]|uniref:trihelix transcription factor ASR3-like n=1 Tax=Apium graveolens TaxID=4045 RepID=UPI003D79B7A2
MALVPVDTQQNVETPVAKVVEGQQTKVDVVEEKNKTARHPRWTRQETLILIEGKKAAENRDRKGRRSSSVFGSDQLEPKWDSVSSYCKKHGVNRGPVQCRKRWSNLVGDFKKIKAWESQELDSYWVMRNDIRKDKKLPGYFDNEVYDVLDGKAYTAAAYQLALVTITADAKNNDEAEAVVAEEAEEVEENAEPVFDSARHATAEDGLFSESEELGQMETDGSPGKERLSADDQAKRIPSPKPISERKYGPVSQPYYIQGTTKEQQPGSCHWKEFHSPEGCKRRRMSGVEACDSNLEDRLVKVLERNASTFNAHLEAQNVNNQLDREQQRCHNENLVAALDKIAGALTKIADKL